MTFIRIGLAASMAICTLLAVPVSAQEKEQEKDNKAPRFGPFPTSTPCRMTHAAGLSGTGATS